MLYYLQKINETVNGVTEEIIKYEPMVANVDHDKNLNDQIDQFFEQCKEQYGEYQGLIYSEMIGMSYAIPVGWSFRRKFTREEHNFGAFTDVHVNQDVLITLLETCEHGDSEEHTKEDGLNKTLMGVKYAKMPDDFLEGE